MWAILWKFWMKTGRFKLVSEAEPQKEKKDLPFFGKSFFSFGLPERLTSGDIRNPRLPLSPEARRKPGFLMSSSLFFAENSKTLRSRKRIFGLRVQYLQKEARKAAEYMRRGFAVKAPFVDNHGAYGVH